VSRQRDVVAEHFEAKKRRACDLLDRNPSDHLAPRELEMMRHLASGDTATEISEAMQISASTLAAYRRNIYLKLGLRNVADVTRSAISWGLVKLPRRAA
jgi:DNA-binding CsgD family transcriptional regulator